MNEYISQTAAHTLSRHTGKAKLPHYYSRLPAFLEKNGMTVRDFFRLLDEPLTWPDERTETFARKLEDISADSALAALDRTAARLLAPVWDRDLWGESPSDRVHAWLKYRLTPTERIAHRKLFEHLSPDFFRAPTRGRLSTEALVPIIRSVGIPMHWALDLPEDMCVMMGDPVRERIMENYMRLPMRSQSVLDRMVDSLMGGNEHE